MIELINYFLELFKEQNTDQLFSDFIEECFVRTGYKKHKLIVENLQSNI